MFEKKISQFVTWTQCQDRLSYVTVKHIQTVCDEKTGVAVGGNGNDIIPLIWCLI